MATETVDYKAILKADRINLVLSDVFYPTESEKWLTRMIGEHFELDELLDLGAGIDCAVNYARGLVDGYIAGFIQKR